MTKPVIKNRLCLLIMVLLSGCSQVVEPVIIPKLSPTKSLQDKIEIELTPLTFDIAKKLNSVSYTRLVSRPGNAFSADVVSETQIVGDKLPPNPDKTEYVLGIGDELQLIQYADASPSVGRITSSSNSNVEFNPGGTSVENINLGSGSETNVIATVGRTGMDGSVLLLEVGRLEVAGKPLSQIREEVRSILIRNGKIPNFQLEIKSFNSKRVYVTTDKMLENQKTSFPITDQGLTLRQAIATSAVVLDKRFLTIITLQRKDKEYDFTLSEVLSKEIPDIFLVDGDHLFFQDLKYIDGKVYLVGGVTPTMIRIKPEERQTLAEVLFVEGGPFETKSAQRSAVYLLRGRNPMHAYHLDVRNPARILLADSLELRPDDIVYVAEQPINTFNRVLETILPLRIFSRDTQNGNLP